MKELLYFILGITFANVIEPLLEKLMAFILTIMDVAIGNCHIQLTQQKKEIEDILERTDNKLPIGFSIEEETVEEDKKNEPDGG